VTVVPLAWVLVLSAALFCVGLYAVLARRNGVTILMGVVLMLNGVIVNVVAFWRYGELGTASGQAFALAVAFAIVAEALVGLALFIALWRSHGTAILDDVDSLGEREGA
jgi:NADH-quinone oxidoreductase subunit K